MEPFDKIDAQNILISFSTGFISKDGDDINPEKAPELGRKLQVKLNGNIPTATLERKLKVKSLAALRKNVTENPATPINALKYFNHLVIFAQTENNLDIILGQHELTPIPISLFSQKDQLMYGGDKASFAQRCLKDNVSPIKIQERMTDTFVVDGAKLLRQTRWEKGFKWGDIIDGYVQFIKRQGHRAINMFVVFDGYQSSTKDHTHRRRQKQFCNVMKISRENTPYTTKEKFLSNGSNKTELISTLVEELRNARILTVRCRDDADTDVVKQCLEHSLKGAVEVRAEDADILIMLTHHYHPGKHQLITVTNSNGNYCVKKISLSLTNEQRQYHLFCHSFTGCDTVSTLYGFSNEVLCFKDVRALIDGFYDDSATKEHVVNAGIEIVQFIYKFQGVLLPTQRVTRYNKQSKTGVL